MPFRLINWRTPFLGIVAIVMTVVIYAANLVFSRFSVQHGLSPYDLTALRFLVAGTLLLPYFLKLGWQDLGGLGWPKGVLLALLAGSPYMWLLFKGLEFAPAAHGAVLNPGIVPSVVFVGLVVLGVQSFSLKHCAGLVLIICGLILVTSASFELKSNVLIGDLLLFATGISWGLFTLLCKLWQIKPLQATAVVCVISMIYLPFYLLFFYQDFEDVSLIHLSAQAIYQGIFNAIIALFLLTYAIEKLGAQHTALFSPLIPVLTTLMAIPALAEIPDLWQWIGIGLVVIGMLSVARMNSSNS